MFPANHLQAQQQFSRSIQWEVGGELSADSLPGKHPGVAGAFSGIHNGVLIIAGGANFPDRLPWEGGKKVHHRSIQVFGKDDGGHLQTIESKTTQLEKAVAYGVSISTPNGIFCAGGESGSEILREAFILKWDAVAKTVIRQELPALPVPLVNAGIASINHTVYVVGGSTGDSVSNKVYALNTSSSDPAWVSLPDMPFAVTHAAVAVQSNGEYACLYVIGGRKATPSLPTTLYRQVLRYDPKKENWHRLKDIGSPSAITTLSAATASGIGSNYIVVMGGDDGSLFLQLENLSFLIAKADPGKKDSLVKERLNLLTHHPGFSKAVYVYNTVTDTWVQGGKFPLDPQVTTNAIRWGDDIIIPSGEIKPGIRTPQIVIGRIQNKQNFSLIDSIVLLLCFGMMTLGRYLFTSKTNTTHDYFKGGQRIPHWAAAVSIFGAKLSAITFMGIPAKTYGTNWTYFFYLMTIVMIMPFVAKFFIPFYRKLNVTSAYEYLEKRLNANVRIMASALYVLLQIGRMGIVILLPSIALTLVTGIDINLCILLIGCISIFFTVKGGIEAVIWVEVIQVIILAVGALFCLFYIPFQLNDWSGGIQALKEYDKLKVFDFRFDFTEPTLWVVLIGGLAINLLTYGTDQTTVQRYLTTKTDKEAVKSLRIGAWLTVPSTLVFFTLGTLMYLFFREQPDQVNIALNNQDNIFPWYIVSQLPVGLSGLLIAGIFAASMSSTEASMNSTATLLTADFYKKRKPSATERDTLFFARGATLILGVFATCISLYMAQVGVSSLWDKFNTILGLFTGCIGGAFLLGIFTKTANGNGVMAGMLLSCVVQILIQQFTQVHLLLYAFTGLVSCFCLGYLFSILLSGKQNKNPELTIYADKN